MADDDKSAEGEQNKSLIEQANMVADRIEKANI